MDRQPHQPLIALLGLLLAGTHASAQTVLLYSRADAARMEQARQVASLYDATLIDRDVPAGASWRAVIATAIGNARMILIVWSARAAASPEVAAEWRMAIASGARVVPVLTDDTPLPPELAARQAIDWR